MTVHLTLTIITCIIKYTFQSVQFVTSLSIKTFSGQTYCLLPNIHYNKNVATWLPRVHTFYTKLIWWHSTLDCSPLDDKLV